MNISHPEVKSFLEQNSLATIAIYGEDGYPHVLPVVYVVDENYNLYFTSQKESHKTELILANPNVGLSITDTNSITTIQLKGKAIVGDQNPAIIAKLVAAANAKSEDSFPPFIKIKNGPLEFIKIELVWYRLADYSEADPIFSESGK